MTAVRRKATAALEIPALVALALMVLAAGCKDRDGEGQSDETAPGNEAGETAPAEDAATSPVASEEPAQVIIDDVAVDLGGHRLETPLRPTELAKMLGRQLTGSGLFFALPNAADPMRPARRARITMEISTQRLDEGSDGKPSLLAAVELRAGWVGESEPFLRENLVGELGLGKIPDSDLARVTSAHVARTIEEAGRGLIRQEELRGGPVSELVKALGQGDAEPNLLRFALQQIPLRRPDSAVELAARHLDSRHPEVRRHAMAALVELEDPRGVDPLAKAADFSDHQAMREVIEAVSAIGGPQAREYLEFVASGHPDPGIVKQAKDALKRL